MSNEAMALKQQIVAALDTLPADALKEVMVFLDYLRFKVNPPLPTKTPFTPVKLGGLLQGYHFSERDIADARQEMWGGLGEPVS